MSAEHTGRLLSRHCDAQSCSLLCTRLLVKPRACASMPACDSGSWSLSCWHRECFLPTTPCQLLLHAASHGLSCRVLAPASPSWVQLPAWQADVPSWVSPEPASLAVPDCFPALREQLLEPGSAGCKLGHSSPEWLCLLAPCLLSCDYLERRTQTDSSALRHLLQKFVLLRNDGLFHEENKTGLCPIS